MKRPVTIVEIAKESGVSVATVSRVTNGTAPVSEKTRPSDECHWGRNMDKERETERGYCHKTIDF